MTVHGSSDHQNSGSRLVPRQLEAARDVLRDRQRELPRGCVAWRATRALIREIDALVPMIAEGQTQSAALNLNAHSESPIKPRTSSRPEGAPISWRAERVAMADGSLESFAEQVRRKNRIGKYDVQALCRDILVDGITTRVEAEFLIALDREVESVHFSWSRFFISALTEFVVWRSGEAGSIDEGKSIWLRSTLAGEGVTDRATRALAAMAREAECFDAAVFPSPSASADVTGTAAEQPGLAA